MKTKNYLFVSFFALVWALAFTACTEDEEGGSGKTITLSCSDFTSDMTLVDDPDVDVDYYIDCEMSVEGNITVNPGVVIEFAPDAGLDINTNGSFNAVGTNANPIILKGRVQEHGSWKGILFNSASSQNKLHFVNMEYAGSAAFNSNGDIASVIIWADSKVDILNCTIARSGNYGISAMYNNANFSVSNTTITQCLAEPVAVRPPYIASFDGTNMLSGNSSDYFLVPMYTYSIEASFTWHNTDVPYRVRSTDSGFMSLSIDNGSVTIEPGTEILFEDNIKMVVNQSGSLNAVGTTLEPIVFSGINPIAGAWAGIEYRFTTSVQNTIKNAQISYAGSGTGIDKGGILTWANPKINIENVTFSNIDGCAIQARTGDLNDVTTSNLTFVNTLGEICQ